MATSVDERTTLANTNAPSSSSAEHVLGPTIQMVPVYTKDQNISIYVRKMEEVAQTHQWADAHTIRMALFRLSEEAFCMVQHLQTSSMGWREFKAELIKTFTKRRYPGQLTAELVRIRQQSDESVREYAARFRALLEESRLEAGTVGNRQPDASVAKTNRDAAGLFLIGLRDPIRKRAMSARPLDLNTAIEIAEQEESIEQLTYQTSALRVRAITSAPDPRRGNARRRGNGPPRRPYRYSSAPPARPTPPHIICYGCQQTGHYRRDCPQNKNPQRPSRNPLNRPAAVPTPQAAAAALTRQ